MYVIRVLPSGTALEASFSDAVETAEALRAVSQALVLAEAGRISAILADVSEVSEAPDLLVVGAALGKRLDPPLRLALVCTAEHLPMVRRLATITGARANLGVFTRTEDATAWLAARPGARVSRTTALHFGASTAPATQDNQQSARRASA